MLDHKSCVELSYYSLKDFDIPIPIFGSAILINSPENAEMACEIGVSVRTVKYWLKELRNIGFIE